MKRLRTGIILILISWVPIAQIGLAIAHNHNLIMGDQASQEFRVTVWGIQIFIGLVGVGLAGRVAIDEAKQEGWKHTPSAIWKLFWQGQQPEPSDDE